jgi:hypothetical protein
MTTVLEKLPAKEEDPVVAKRIRTTPATPPAAGQAAVPTPAVPPKRPSQTRTISVTRIPAETPSENGADKRR